MALAYDLKDPIQITINKEGSFLKRKQNPAEV